MTALSCMKKTNHVYFAHKIKGAGEDVMIRLFPAREGEQLDQLRTITLNSSLL